VFNYLLPNSFYFIVHFHSIAEFTFFILDAFLSFLSMLTITAQKLSFFYSFLNLQFLSTLLNLLFAISVILVHLSTYFTITLSFNIPSTFSFPLFAYLLHFPMPPFCLLDLMNNPQPFLIKQILILLMIRYWAQRHKDLQYNLLDFCG